MERKNTMLLTVIAVATLLVAVVGATFAYYSVTGSNTTTTTGANVTTEKVGQVTLSQGVSNIYLNVTAEQMALGNYGEYYGVTPAGAAVKNTAQNHTLATIAATAGETNTVYTCRVGYSISIAQVANSKESAYTALGDDDADIVISLVPEEASGNTATLLAGTRHLSTLKTNAETGTSVVTIHGNTNLVVKGDVVLHNLQNDTQNDIAELGANVTFDITSFSCDTTAGA